MSEALGFVMLVAAAAVFAIMFVVVAWKFLIPIAALLARWACGREFTIRKDDKVIGTVRWFSFKSHT